MKRIALEHNTFGDLLVVAYAGMDRGCKHALYLTKCVKCGRERIRRGYELLHGSCVCPACRKPARPVKAPAKNTNQKKAKAKVAAKATKTELREKFQQSAPTVDRARFRYTHLRSRAWRNSIIPPQEPGASKLPFYQRWKGMMNRCYNDSHTNFPAYGGRGIFVEKVWHNAYAYNTWAVEHGLAEPGMTVDRIDVDGPYGPNNCRVVPKSMNVPEGRKFYGVRLKTLRLMAQLNCGEDAPSATTISQRLERGEDILSAISPVRGPKYSPPKTRTIEQQLRRRLDKIKARVKSLAYRELGVYVCEEWLGREGAARFVKWAIGMGFRPELTLDRINNYGPYSPGNCRWVDRSTQNLNKRHTRPDFASHAHHVQDGVKNPITPF